MMSYPIIDAHQHSGPWPFPGRWGGLEENLRLMELRGIDAAIVSSARAVVQDMVAGNAELAESIAGHARIYGYVTVTPSKIDLSCRELQRYESDPQFVGAKVHTDYSGCAMGDPRLASLMAVLQERGRPLLLHTWGAEAVAHLSTLAARYSKLPIIVAHAGADAWRKAIAAAGRCSNLYLDFTSSTPYSGAVTRALAKLGPERIVFGTDAALFDPLYVKAIYDQVEMSTADRALVMGGNAIRLFGIAP